MDVPLEHVIKGMRDIVVNIRTSKSGLALAALVIASKVTDVVTRIA
jgi:hypothetical protein